MLFWRLAQPHRDSDYQSLWVNGSLEHPFGLPGVKCEVCGETWAGSRVLPFICPNSLRGETRLQEGWPIPLSEHLALQTKVREHFLSHDIHLPPLWPGDDFQPCFLDAPSFPRADFLWAGLTGPVVSARVKRLFESLNIPKLAFCAVSPRRIGRGDATAVAPVPQSGEPEDMMLDVPLIKDTASMEPYFELLIQAESERPQGSEPESICSGCGREQINSQRRYLAMFPHMWRGDSIFVLSTTLYILITDDLKATLEEHKFTNVAFEPWPTD